RWLTRRRGGCMQRRPGGVGGLHAAEVGVCSVGAEASVACTPPRWVYAVSAQRRQLLHAAEVGDLLPAPCSPTAFAVARPVGPIPGRTATARSLSSEAAGRRS